MATNLPTEAMGVYFAVSVPLRGFSDWRRLAKLVEDERKSHRGSYENAENFSQRLTALHESFPWGEFAQMLDFCQM